VSSYERFWTLRDAHQVGFPRLDNISKSSFGIVRGCGHGRACDEIASDHVLLRLNSKFLSLVFVPFCEPRLGDNKSRDETQSRYLSLDSFLSAICLRNATATLQLYAGRQSVKFAGLDVTSSIQSGFHSKNRWCLTPTCPKAQ